MPPTCWPYPIVSQVWQGVDINTPAHTHPWTYPPPLTYPTPDIPPGHTYHPQKGHWTRDTHLQKGHGTRDTPSQLLFRAVNMCKSLSYMPIDKCLTKTEWLSGRALNKPEIVGSNLGIFLTVSNTKLYNVGNWTEVIFMSLLTSHAPGLCGWFFYMGWSNEDACWHIFVTTMHSLKLIHS